MNLENFIQRDCSFRATSQLLRNCSVRRIRQMLLQKQLLECKHSKAVFENHLSLNEVILTRHPKKYSISKIYARI